MKRIERYESAAIASPRGAGRKPVDVPRGRPAGTPRNEGDLKPFPHPPPDPRPDG
ncbi:MAG TPA: hypothetical protein VGG06_04830 [Thermoanaerobaculia bacterium]